MTVSYVLTVYNKAPFLPEVLKAVAAERAESGGEIIVVNDGSKDDSGRILDEFAVTGPDIRIVHQANAGVVRATNVGLGLARHPYIRLVDGVDIVARGSTRLLMRLMAESGCGYVFGGLGNYDLGNTQAHLPGVKDGPGSKKVADPLAAMIRAQLFVVSASLGKKEVYDRVLPLPEQYFVQDMSLGLLLAMTTDFLQIDDVYCYAPRVAPGRITDSKARLFRDSVLIVRDMVESWAPRYRAQAVRRNATRASHYLRRHVPGSGLSRAELLMYRLFGGIPGGALQRRMLERIAGSYDGNGDLKGR